MPNLIFCHYTPYDFQMRSPNEPCQGVSVLPYSLVCHDCVIEPWMMERVVDSDDYTLYALFNGRVPHLIRDATYIDVDDDMDGEQHTRTENDIERRRTVAAFYERVGMQELARHEFVDDDPLVQRSVFVDGTVVTYDFHAQTYHITDCPHHQLKI